MNDLPLLESQFPAGTPVCVTMTTRLRGRDIESRVVGVVESWDCKPTGSWYAHGKNNKLWLDRVRVRRVDGEVTLLIIDDGASIARLEPMAM